MCNTQKLDNTDHPLFNQHVMTQHTRISCPFCRRSFILPSTEAWRRPLARLLQPFTETASPIATRSLIVCGMDLGMWTSYPGGSRRLLQLELEGILIKLDQGWWILSEVGKDIGRHAEPPDIPLLTAITAAAEVPEQSEIVPTPSDELLHFLMEFVNFPQFASLARVVRYAVQCGMIEPRGARGKVNGLIANGYLRWVQGKLVLSPASVRILAREFPAVDRAPGVDD